MKLKIILAFITLALVSSCASTEDSPKEKSVEEKKAEVYYNQGTSDLVSKNYQSSLTNLLRAKELNPNDSKIRTNLGMAYYFREQIQYAIQEIKEAISLDEKNTDAKLNLATIYLEQNKLNEAKALYLNSLKDLTYNALFRVHYNLAILNLKIGDRKSAFDELNLAIKEKEDYCQAHYKLGELYTEEYRYKDALNSFVSSTKGTCVANPEPHFAVATALVNLNRFQEAKTKFQNIIDKFPKSNFKALAQKQIKNLNHESVNETANNMESQTINSQQTETPKF